MGALVLWFVTPTVALLDVQLPWAPLLLGVLFIAAEAVYLSVEYRRQTYSFTMTSVPLLLGVLCCPLWQVLSARLIGSAAVMLARRVTPLKAFYSLAGFAFETALVGWLLHQVILGRLDELTLNSATSIYAVMAGTDLLMTGLMLLLVRLNGTVLNRSVLAEAVVPATIWNAAAVAYALTTLLLLQSGTIGLALLSLLSLGSVIGYRRFTLLTARHQSVTQMGMFVEDDEPGADIEELAQRQLEQVRTFLRASRAQALLPGDEDGAYLLLSIGDDDDFSVTSVPAMEMDWLHRRVIEQDEPVLVPRTTREEGLRSWLRDHQARDAVIVPLRQSRGMRGTLAVSERLADNTSFREDDVIMLRMLAGHLAVALRSTALLRRLQHDATHDTLTGLANRSLLQRRIAQTLRRTDCRAALLMLDLNGFKEVNDTLGHDVGDRLLKVVGERLVQALPSSSVVARLGGDEYAVFLTEECLLATGGTSPDDVGRLASALAVGICAPVVFDEGTVSVEASIGSATTRHAKTGADLLRHADTAMYASRRAGTGVAAYTQEMDRGRSERLALMADLRLALERDELVVFFQPKLDLARNVVTGAECLVRWQHPRLGLLSADAFVPLAESSGLVDEFTRIVLDKALNACRRIRESGHDITVSVNLSARNLTHPRLAADVVGALRRARVPASALVLEITESSVMADPDASLQTLNQLVKEGIVLSLDDFGTGYSSLAYLQRLPVQEVKIDRSFVMGLSDQHAGSTILVESIVGLGRSFGLHVVAEGVEDLATLDLLTKLGCDSAQGYVLSRPVAEDALIRVINDIERLVDRRLLGSAPAILVPRQTKGPDAAPAPDQTGLEATPAPRPLAL